MVVSFIHYLSVLHHRGTDPPKLHLSSPLAPGIQPLSVSGGTGWRLGSRRKGEVRELSPFISVLGSIFGRSCTPYGSPQGSLALAELSWKPVGKGVWEMPLQIDPINMAAGKTDMGTLGSQCGEILQ